MNGFQWGQQHIRLMKKIVSAWTWMGKGLSSMALSPTMESHQHLIMSFSTSSCKETGKTWWWQCMRVVLVSLKGNSEVICQLQCKCCDHIPQHLQPLQCLQDTIKKQELSSPKPSTASTSGAIGRASMAFESCDTSQPRCYACTPLHVLASATGQLGYSCTPSCAPRWQ